MAEDQRIAEEGQKAISGMLDEDLVEATQTLRALEDGDEEDFYPIEASAPSPERAVDTRASKRVKSNGGTTRDGSQKQNGAVGMFSADAMDNLRFYAEMTRKQAEEDKEKQGKPTMASLLGGYGSGDESDQDEAR